MPRTPKPPAPARFSHTFLELCRSCLAAAAAKLRGEPQETPDNVKGGGDLHEGLARYGVGCWERRVSRDKELMTTIAAGYAPETRRSLEAFAADARWPWKKMAADGTAQDGTPAPIEQYMEARLPNGALWCGVIDLALVERGAAKDNPFCDSDDIVRLVDWKQGRPAAWNSPDAPPQLLGYGVLWRLLNPEQQDYYLLYGAPGWQGKWEFREWSVGRIELDAYERHLCGVTSRILAEETWEATPGDACARCFYMAACPVRGTETFATLTGLDADALSAATAWHAAKSAEARKRLKALEKAAGGPVGAARWGWGDKTKLKPVMDEGALDEVLQTRGHSVKELQTAPTWSKTAVAKAVKAGWLEEDALEAVVSGREFAPQKADEETAGEAGEGQGGSDDGTDA